MSEQSESQSLYTDEAPAPQQTASRWEDFIDIFYAPSQVFARRMRSGFGVPMLVVTLVVGILGVVNSSANDAMMDADMARSQARQAAKAASSGRPQPTEQQMEIGRKIAHTMTKIGAFVIMPIIMVVLGLILAGVGRLFGAAVPVSAAIMIAAYSYVPRVVEGVVNCVQALLIDTSTITSRLQFSLGAGRFLDPDTASPVVVALLARVDVFTIWVTVLLAIGLHVVGKIPMAKAAMAGVVMWMVGALFLVLPALLAG